VNPEGAIALVSSRELNDAAQVLGRQIRTHTARNEAEIEAAFTTLSQLHARALLIMGDSFFSSRSQQIGEMAARHAIPAVSTTREFAVVGGLMSYAPVDPMQLGWSALNTGRILTGLILARSQASAIGRACSDLCHRPVEVLQHACRACRQEHVQALHRPTAAHQVGGLLQGAVRRTRAGAALPLPLHAYRPDPLRPSAVWLFCVASSYSITSSAVQQRFRYLQAECLCGLEVDTPART
jgi:hypothetical protein